MNTLVNQSLKKVVKSAGLVLLGTGAEAGLGIIIKLVIIRWVLTKAELGEYSLALSCFTILMVLSTLGLRMGTPRQIGFYKGAGEEGKIRAVIISSIQIATVSSVILAIVLFFASSLIADFTKMPGVSTPIMIFAIGIPFLALIRIAVSIYRGFGKTAPKVYFSNLLRNALFLSFIGGIILFGLSVNELAWAFVSAIICTLLAITVYFFKNSPLPLRKKTDAPSKLVRKELLLFSLPLLGTMLPAVLINHLDTIFIGLYMNEEDVGLYNAAVPLVHLLPTVLATVKFLYIPLMSELYGRSQFVEIKRSYAILTKWTFSIILPLFLVFVLFPEATLNTLCGTGWADAAPVLRILAIGFFISCVLGPNGVTLVAMGKPKFLLFATITSLIANIILNILLIPPLGLTGAAIATASALGMRNIMISMRLYMFSRIHPFSINYIKPTLVSTVIILIIYILVDKLISGTPLWLLPLLLVLFLATYGISILLTKSFDKEDLMMLLAIEKKAGLNLAPVKKVLNKFV